MRPTAATAGFSDFSRARVERGEWARRQAGQVAQGSVAMITIEDILAREVERVRLGAAETSADYVTIGQNDLRGKALPVFVDDHHHGLLVRAVSDWAIFHAIRRASSLREIPRVGS